MVANEYIFNILSERIGFKLRRDLVKSLLEKDMAFYTMEEHTTGALSKYELKLICDVK